MRRTHKALHSAILALMQELPYEAITVQGIAERADLNRATFYLHFGSKEELLAASLESHFDALVARITETRSDVPFWEDATSAVMVFEYVAENHELYTMMLGEKGLGHVIHRILQYLAWYDEMELTRFLPAGVTTTIPIPVLSHHLAGSLFALAKWWLDNGMPYSPAEMAEMLRKVCEIGVRGLIEEAGEL